MGDMLTNWFEGLVDTISENSGETSARDCYSVKQKWEMLIIFF